ncbi:MAG: hypothetical protein ACREMY_11090, partial [bacterium]
KIVLGGEATTLRLNRKLVRRELIEMIPIGLVVMNVPKNQNDSALNPKKAQNRQVQVREQETLRAQRKAAKKERQQRDVRFEKIRQRCPHCFHRRPPLAASLQQLTVDAGLSKLAPVAIRASSRNVGWSIWVRHRFAKIKSGSALLSN